jgi:phosphotransferase system HPr-like phosphotransfer protein
MKGISVLLSTINDVKEFVNIVTRFDYEVDLISGRYAVDAKSIMGIFSLDLAKPITVRVHNDDSGEFLAAIDKFIVK